MSIEEKVLTDEEIQTKIENHEEFIREGNAQHENITNGSYSLLNSCRICRIYCFGESRYGNLMESRQIKVFGLTKTPQGISGDAEFNEKDIEIKTSFSNEKNGSNGAKQIRTNDNIKYYILFNYDKGNLRHLTPEQLSKFVTIDGDSIDGLDVFCVPAPVMRSLIVKFGTYTHGTKKANGVIDEKSVENSNYEYSLMFNKHASSSLKTGMLWYMLQAYKIDCNDQSSLHCLIK